MFSVKPTCHILYLTVDGLLEPLGTSQVARVMMSLTDLNPRYQLSICSLEKPADRVDGIREKAMEATLHSRGISWRRHEYLGGGILGVTRNLARLYRLASAVIEEEGVDLIHARSYVGAEVARRLKNRYGVDYLFDMRGFWVDERIEQGRWFRGGVSQAAARRWEGHLIADAAGLVTLTEEAGQEIRRRQNDLSPSSTHGPVEVIPTCVDYGEFGLGGPGSAAGIPRDLRERLEASLVVGFVGAVDQAYFIEESIRLFDHLLALRPDAHLLCLTRNPPALLQYLRQARIPDEQVTIRSVTHQEMPAWLSLMDWGLLLRKVEPSHRGAMPTKLAEFFASGVRPIQYGCNQEVRSWVERAESGLVLDELDEESLRQAAQSMAAHDAGIDSLLSARWKTRKHFDLREGARRYGKLYEQILSPSSSPDSLRILFLTEGQTVPASRFRVEQFLPYFRRQGIHCELRSGYGPRYSQIAPTVLGTPYKIACRMKRFAQINDAEHFDLVFAQRPALPYTGYCERLLANKNPRLILDIDDAVFVSPNGHENPRLAAGIRESVDAAALLICGNQYLADRLDRGHTRVIPTVVDTTRYRPPDTPSMPDDHDVVIGWMGTSSNFVSLHLVAPLLRQLLHEMHEKINLRVRIVSDQVFPALTDVAGVEMILWNAHEELSLLQSFTIGIMPLIDNPSTRGKCGFKALQYMAVGLPVVASAVGANLELLGDSGAALLASNPLEFEQALRQLIHDPTRRCEMAAKARSWVKKHYSIQAVLPRYLHLFEELARSQEDYVLSPTG